MPAYDHKLYVQCAMSLFALSRTLTERKIPSEIYYIPGYSLIHMVRNACITHFYHSTKYSHMLFIDSDMEFYPKTILRMLSFDKQIVGAAYPKKVYNLETAKGYSTLSLEQMQQLSLNYIGGSDDKEIISGKRKLQKKEPFLKVNELGTGILLIRRDAVHELITTYPDLHYRAPPNLSSISNTSGIYGFFDHMKDENDLPLGEDNAFCKRWIDAGGELWCDIESKIVHHGHEAFSGAFIDTMTARFNRRAECIKS